MSKRRLVYSFLTVVFVLFLSTSAFGAGFALYEGSARGNVLGAGLTATADDPSAVFYNPAGITQLKGTQIMAGATFIYPKMDVYTTPGGMTTSKENWWIPPHAYMTYQLNDKWWAGLGMFSRFGLGTEFDSNWPGRYNSYYARIRTAELNPNIAYKVNDKFSVAAGLNIMWMELKLEQRISAGSFGGPGAIALGDANSSLKGDSFGWGFNLAAQYKPTDDWYLGASYRSRVSQHIEGDADFTKPAAWAAFGGANAVLLRDTKAAGNVRLPDEVFAGVAWKVIPTVTLGGGIFWTKWSAYDKLQITYQLPIAPGVGTVVKQKQWEDTYRFMIGGEWKFMPNWRASVSYAYDQEPVQDQYADYLIPANDRNMYSAGLGWDYGKFTTDFSYTLIMINERHIPARPADGVLQSEFKNGIAHLFGFSLGYKF
jgi:long-chain fatty acid transport protein